MNRRYEYMTPPEFEAALGQLPVFFLPAGLLEWHSNHLPLGLDYLKAHALCQRIADDLGGGIVMPPIWMGRPGFSAYLGTLTYSEGAVYSIFQETLAQLKKLGAKAIVVITGHYGDCQIEFIKRVCETFGRENPDVAIFGQPEYEGALVDGQQPADHAGMWETALFMALRPELVRMDQFDEHPAGFRTYSAPPNAYYPDGEEWAWRNDVRAATPQLGERAIQAISAQVRARLAEVYPIK